MLVQADGIARAGYAIKERSTGNIVLTEICDEETSAYELQRAMAEKQPHRGEWVVVPVVITVTEASKVEVTKHDRI